MAARQFEGLLIFELLKVMRQTIPNGGSLDPNDFGGSMHQQMFDEQLANTLNSLHRDPGGRTHG
mgnify:CR=1 FL=1